MPLIIELRDASGNVLKRTGETPPKRLLPIPDASDSTFPLLRGVDPYGDTFFTSLQTQWLVRELETLRDRATKEERKLLDDVIVLARECTSGPHRFLVFVGD